jgi:hypothetical protein
MDSIKNPEQLKNLEIVVSFYRYLLKQPEHSHRDILVEYLGSCLDREVLFTASSNMTHREIMNYRARLLDYIKS